MCVWIKTNVNTVRETHSQTNSNALPIARRIRQYILK